MPLLTTDALTKRYPGGVTALDGLTLTLEPGIIGLVGANGAGKSTFLRILLGLLEPTSGSATVLGRDVRSDGSELRRFIGYMPESDCLPPDVTATDFVGQMGRLSGLPVAAARERTADTLRHVGLYEERYRPIGGYSTGMKQRVKLAQSLVHDPALVLLDEPTNGLDPGGRDEMLGLIRRIGTEFGISLLVTSHLLGELERICDHVVVIDGGRLLRSTSTADMTSASGAVAVEVTARADQLAALLQRAGLAVQPAGRRGDGFVGDTTVLAVELAGEATYDLIRDTVAELGVGLVRMQPRRHHIVEIFKDAAGGPA